MDDRPLISVDNKQNKGIIKTTGSIILLRWFSALKYI